MNAATKSLPDLLTVKETQAYLRIGRRLAYEAIARGDIPSIRIGGSIRIPRDALLAKIAAVAAPKESAA